MHVDRVRENSHPESPLHASSPPQNLNSDDLPVDDYLLPPPLLTIAGPAQPMDPEDSIYDDWDPEQWPSPTPELPTDAQDYSYSPDDHLGDGSQNEDFAPTIDYALDAHESNRDSDAESVQSFGSQSTTGHDYFPPSKEQIFQNAVVMESDESDIEDQIEDESVDSDEDWLPYRNRKVF
ncbi:hypothetical protein VKT23_010926 [Stygiomarasmius scandens]|uniref:Uncharacterized protein n=1 Tax=Marasmiellus scandens TaxID=2682957 RepID=A0ABR1JAI3_9AGAR